LQIFSGIGTILDVLKAKLDILEKGLSTHAINFFFVFARLSKSWFRTSRALIEHDDAARYLLVRISLDVTLPESNHNVIGI